MTTDVTHLQRRAILDLWNNEYPAQLLYGSLSEVDGYLDNLGDPKHYFAEWHDSIVGWAFSFVRETDRWFAIIVDSKYHGRKIGAALLNAMKQDETVLNGWVTDHSRYLRADGSPYKSPLAFYQKNGFEILHDTRLEIPKLSAVKIRWCSAGPR